MPQVFMYDGELGSLSPEERYRLLVDAVTDYALYMLDPVGNIVSWNSGAERFKGYTADEVIGRNFSIFYTPEDRERGAPQAALAAAAAEGRFEIEAWRVRKDGSRFWANVVIDPVKSADGRIIGFAKITRDDTDKRAAREALLESERRFRILVQGVTDYAIYMLDPEGRITNWNVGAERIKGYSADEVIGHHFSRFYTEQDLAIGLPAIALKTAAEQGKFEAEGWRLRKDGSRFWANVVVDAVRDPDGKLVGFAKITRDVTEKRAASEALAQAQQALFQSQKLEAIGQLTGGVAHDFNNLLTVIVSSLEILRKKVVDSREIRILDNALAAADRGSKLTSQLLAFARKQALTLSLENPNVLIESFETILRRGAGEMMNVDLRLGAEMRMVELDTAQFEAALLNLVVNARDACGPQGLIQIHTGVEEVTEERRLLMSAMPPGAYVFVSVSDDGKGMSPEVLAHACEPFYTTKGLGEGTGLGLSQVYGFASQCGGHIDIQSAEGKGTKVVVYLPARELAPDNPKGREKGAKPIVLIVDDDRQVLNTAAELFESIGYKVLTASDGVAALDMLKRDRHIDLLFSDIVMPRGITGIELSQQAKMLRPGMKILLSSGYPLPAMGADQADLRDTAFISKPYRWTELVDRLRALDAVIS